MSRTHCSASAEDAPKAVPLYTVSRPTSVPPRSSSYRYALRERGSGNSLRDSEHANHRIKTVDLSAPFAPLRPSLRVTTVNHGRRVLSSNYADSTIDTCPFPLRQSTSNNQPAKDKARRKLHAGANPHHSPYPTPPSSPDRFIPIRKSSGSLSKSFQANKSPERLSPTERVLRHQSASEDPFRRRRVSPITNRNDSTAAQPAVSIQDPSLPQSPTIAATPRVLSVGAVWNVGGAAPATASPIVSVSDGRGGLLGSGTNAPMFGSSFFESETSNQSLERFEGRLAAALGIDQTSRILNFSTVREMQYSLPTQVLNSKIKEFCNTVWRDGRWDDQQGCYILDAPSLRDDFYCSILAYCHESRTLAVGLNNRVYLWSEARGVTYPPMKEERGRGVYVSSLSFSSATGGNCILAIGRSNGKVSLWSLYDDSDRFQCQQPNAIACLAFKPVPTNRVSESFGTLTPTEDLVVGDELGNIYYYSIEWETHESEAGASGSMNLLVKIDIHTQQICGIAWSPDGEYFATGSNDNACLLFCSRDILTPPAATAVKAPLPPPMTGLIPSFIPNAHSHFTLGSMMGASVPGDALTPLHESVVPYRAPTSGAGRIIPTLLAGYERHRWLHSAAVKAIAFCPWQKGLLATGGGSNDRAIHFYHAWSGACLATINVQAQVTSLIWSNTRREIAATFGYAQPEHPYRIAVFSWPECKQVVSIPWNGEIRALYAIPYPGGPNQSRKNQSAEGERWWKRTSEEGCIVVASSDESVKFHEVWSEGSQGMGNGVGGLGWSDILEGLEGIEKEGGEVIR